MDSTGKVVQLEGIFETFVIIGLGAEVLCEESTAWQVHFSRIKQIFMMKGIFSTKSNPDEMT